MDTGERFRGCLLGLAVGDAVGTTVEFRRRGSFEPLTDMVGGGPFGLRPGQWTDDTSMALCLATSLLERGGFDAHDQMQRYCRWADAGYLSSTGVCFDIGTTVKSALQRYQHDGNPYAGSTDPHSAGNGCIMRLAPIPMFFFPDLDAVEQAAGESSRTTHGAAECVEACRLLGRIICRALADRPKEEVLMADAGSMVAGERVRAIAAGSYRTTTEADIRGTGYVIESLEAALWAFARTETFQDAILVSANLGDDADTTAAVCGQVAGAYYGIRGIPTHWLERLALGSEIARLADRLRARREPSVVSRQPGDVSTADGRQLMADDCFPWRRALMVWLLLVVVEVLHGTLRTLLVAPLTGDWPARQFSVLTGSLLILAIAWLTIRWLGPRSRTAVLGIGALWLFLMLSFELVLGRLVLGIPWEQLRRDYDLRHGGFLGLGMASLALSPWIAARLRGCLPSKIQRPSANGQTPTASA
jgi:ADP-ribosyl-[dinitrogen reductase] hydrolase